MANLNKFPSLQNSVCRTLLKCNRRTPINAIHNDLNLFHLKERRDYNLSLDCHNYILKSESSPSKYHKTRILGQLEWVKSMWKYLILRPIWAAETFHIEDQHIGKNYP